MLNTFLQPSIFDSVILTTAAGKKYNISTLVKEINLYENLFNNFMTADITILDTPETRVIQNGLKTALDTISFSFAGKKEDETSEKLIKQTLYVYKSHTSPPGNNQSAQSITIQLASFPFFLNNTKDISRYFNGQITDNVRKLAKEIEIGTGEYKLEIEPSDENMSGIITYKSVFETINMFAARCRPSRNTNDLNYIFYENVDSTFKFISIGSLLASSSVVGTDSKTGFVVLMPNNISSSYLKRAVLTHTVSEQSSIKNAFGGMFTSSVLTFDMTTKTYNENTFSYDVNFPKQSKLSTKKIIDAKKYENFSKLVNNSFFSRYTQKSQYCMECDESPEGQDKVGGGSDWLLPRISMMQQLNQINMTFTVPGNSDIRVGNTFFFGRPGQQSLSKDNPEKDFLYNGKYMATEIKHSIKNNTGQSVIEYTTTIKCTKDSLGNE